MAYGIDITIMETRNKVRRAGESNVTLSHGNYSVTGIRHALEATFHPQMTADAAKEHGPASNERCSNDEL